MKKIVVLLSFVLISCAGVQKPETEKYLVNDVKENWKQMSPLYEQCINENAQYYLDENLCVESLIEFCGDVALLGLLRQKFLMPAE